MNYFKKLDKKLSRRSGESGSGSIKHSYPEPLIVPRSEHTVSRADISEYALKVLYRLDKNGFQAYLVGGGVRDVLLGHHPKDFDIVTDATPEEVRSIFSNCRLIGRRFRLAHVFFGREIIEVATFRGPTQEEGSANQGMILRDNVYGTLEEDAWRRDFTVNALYYNIADFTLVDHTGGLQDLKDKVLRIIGDPHQRLREDPVRMLRAIRFAAKLDLQLLPDLESAIRSSVHLLAQVSPSRLFEEVLKMFHGGAAMKVYIQLLHIGLFEKLFEQTHKTLEKNYPYHLQVSKLITLLMTNTDKRMQEGKPVAPAFLLATLLWTPFCDAIIHYLGIGENEFSARLKAMNAVLSRQTKQLNIPKRIILIVKEIWTMQFRLQRKEGKRAERLFYDQRFRAGYDLLVFRAQAGESVAELANWWSAYSEGSIEQRQLLSKSLGKESKTTKKAKKPKKLKKSEPVVLVQPIQTVEENAEFKLEADSPFTENFYFDET